VLISSRVTGFQALMLQGMKMTSPAIASAMPNLAPGFIFVISGCLGYYHRPPAGAPNPHAEMNCAGA
jgi:hypothetical protein